MSAGVGVVYGSLFRVLQCLTFQCQQPEHSLMSRRCQSGMWRARGYLLAAAAAAVSVKKFKWLRKAHGFIALACNFSCHPAIFFSPNILFASLLIP